MEKNHAREHALLMPVVESMAGRHEDKFSAAILQGRFRQAVDNCAAIVPHATFMHHQHGEGGTRVVVNSSASVGLDDLDLHARPLRRSATNGVRWGNLHDPTGRGDRGSMIELASAFEIRL